MCRIELRLKMYKTTAEYLLTEPFPAEAPNESQPPKYTSSHLPSINELGKQLLGAAGAGSVEDIRSLMAKGAPFTADWLGTSPLHLAAQNNHLEACEILLVAGMSRDARTKVDRTPLHVACYEGHLQIVECLLRYSADYDAKDILEMTPLHWATQNGHAEIAELLIRYGAQTAPVNKFNLTPADIAAQVSRPDIGELISQSIRDPLVATQNLALQLMSEEAEQEQEEEPIDMMSESMLQNGHVGQIHLESIMVHDDEDEDPMQPETILQEPANLEEITDEPEEITQVEPEEDNQFTESMKLLQQHGITMLPVDENNILNSVMESGHSVVLTEAGKQALNALKPVEPAAPELTQYLKPKVVVKKKRIITLTPEEFLAMTNGKPINTLQNNGLKQLKLLNSPKSTIKRIVMRKNKILPVSPSVNVGSTSEKQIYDAEHLMHQLQKAHALIESYKRKLLKSEVEAAKYKQQLKLLLEQHKLTTS